MSEHMMPIPSRLYNAAVGGHVAGADQIIDDNENKEQSQINAEVKQSLGQGGSVDLRIENAVNIEKERAQEAEQFLQEQYNALTQSDIIIGALPASGTKNKIYRVPGTTSYSDYMWNGSSFVKMAEYDNAIDDEPIAGSNNLVKSGGVEESENQKGLYLSRALNSQHKIIEKGLYEEGKVIRSDGQIINNASYSISNIIKIEQFTKVLIIGGGSQNIAACAMYDANDNIVKMVIPDGFECIDFMVDDIPTEAESIRFSILNELIDSSFTILYNDNLLINSGFHYSHNVSEERTYGYRLDESLSEATPNKRGCAFMSAAGYLNEIYIHSNLTDNYADTVVRDVDFRIYHLDEQGKAILKDSFIVTMRSGTHLYKNGVDFDYKKKLDAGDAVVYDSLHYLFYVKDSKYCSFMIDGNNTIEWAQYGISLQYSVTSSLYDIDSFGTKKTEYQDIMMKMPEKKYVIDSGITENDIKLASTDVFSNIINEGDHSRGVAGLSIDDEELCFQITPLTENFDIRVGTRSSFYGTFVGIKNDGIYIYNQLNGIQSNNMVEIFAGWTKPSFNMNFYQNVTYNITLRRITNTASYLIITISSSAGDYRTGVFCLAGYNDRLLYGMYGFENTQMHGNPAVFAVTGNVRFSKFRLRFPYKKDCHLIVYGHSFVEGNSIPFDKEKRFASLIQQNIGAKNCCILGTGGDSITTISSQHGQIRAMVQDYGYVPKYILQVMGANDSSRTYEYIIGKLEEFISFCSTNNIIPVLTTIPPINNNISSLFTQVNTWIRNSGQLYADIEKCFIDKDGNVKIDMYLEDEVHPNIQGHAAIYNTILHDVPQLFELNNID